MNIDTLDLTEVRRHLIAGKKINAIYLQWELDSLKRKLNELQVENKRLQDTLAIEQQRRFLLEDGVDQGRDYNLKAIGFEQRMNELDQKLHVILQHVTGTDE